MGRTGNRTTAREHSKKHAAHAHLITSADLMAGAVMPIKLRLNVTVRPGSREAATGMTLPIEHRLAKHAPQMHAWAKRSAENAALLITDPAGAVARARIRMAPQAQ